MMMARSKPLINLRSPSYSVRAVRPVPLVFTATRDNSKWLHTAASNLHSDASLWHYAAPRVPK